ncbi:class F sortase [Microbacterium caowuchunii]|uniref:class F sortase n=1 Tax=Microbacterium caowuchunii TaxID=2614638 RepID=UPI001244F127|nr:class F sortase [Microbacterium caowuchunii]QEV99377.1 class F sortase [Microbacterium caowuchunii]
MSTSAGRAIAAAFGAVAIALALTACAGGAAAPTAEPTAPPSPSATPAPTPVRDVPVAPATAAPAQAVVPPVRVTVPSAGVEVPVVPVAVDTGGFMELPVDPAVAGWYRYGSGPSSPEGNTVISAHVDAPDYPIGPFSRLRDLAAGDVVQVTDGAGATHAYSVTDVVYHRKTELPVAELFSRTGDPALVLITCGGEYDPSVGRYEENVVVTATPVP